MGVVKNRPGLIAFKRLSEQDQKQLLFNIEAALYANATRVKSIPELEIEVSNLLNIALTVVKEVSSTKQFKTKVSYRMM